MDRRLVLAAALALGALAPPAAAKPPKFTLKVKPATETVKLGERIPVEVTLQSRAAKAAAASPLRIASPNGLVFYIRTAAKDFQVSRIYGRYQNDKLRPDPVARQEIKPGGSMTATVQLLGLVPGKMEITAVYLGLDAVDSAEPIEAKPFTVTVEPGPGGETRVGARIRTSKGEMTAELYPEKTYNTVHNFLLLAMDRFYEKQTFHRVIKGFMVQTGDPKGDGTGGPGYYIPAELRDNQDVKHEKGVLSMAREGHLDTAGSQFFVMHGASPGLDGKYTAFGRVVQGKETVEALAGVPVKPNLGGEMSDPVEKPTLDGVDLVLLK